MSVGHSKQGHMIKLLCCSHTPILTSSGRPTKIKQLGQTNFYNTDEFLLSIVQTLLRHFCRVIKTTTSTCHFIQIHQDIIFQILAFGTIIM